jgi:DNA-binding CsgD family transcriptional regulator
VTYRHRRELSDQALYALASQARSRSEFRREVLSRLSKAVGYETGFYNDEGATAATDPHTVSGMDPGILTAVRKGWQRYASGLLPVLEALPTNRVVVDAKVVGWEGLARSDLYQEIMRPHGWRATAYAYLQLSADHTPAIIALLRGRRDRDFDGRSLSFLKRLVPMLSLADAALGRIGEAATRLGPDERELAQYVSNGYSNREIAAALNQSVFTIRNRLARLFEKYDIGSRSELAHRFGRDLR